eukprot:Tamp_14187.p2 GENE.Tamp_14187~~Tamp_14187.p2  ORF type:complete len:148 (+),score=23.17 Tamp_14187:1133-1576(+)
MCAGDPGSSVDLSFLSSRTAGELQLLGQGVCALLKSVRTVTKRRACTHSESAKSTTCTPTGELTFLRARLRACRACVCVHWLDDTETQREGGEEGEDQTFSPRAEEQQVKIDVTLERKDPSECLEEAAEMARFRRLGCARGMATLRA